MRADILVKELDDIFKDHTGLPLTSSVEADLRVKIIKLVEKAEYDAGEAADHWYSQRDAEC